MKFTNAVLAMEIARFARDLSTTVAFLAEGMHNPNFCAADATDYGASLVSDLRTRLDRIETRMRDKEQ